MPSSSDSNTASLRATIGSLTCFARQRFYLSVSYPFEDVSEIPVKNGNSEFEFSGFSDEEEELDADQFQALYSRSITSQSSDSQPSEDRSSEDHTIEISSGSLSRSRSDASMKHGTDMSCS